MLLKIENCVAVRSELVASMGKYYEKEVVKKGLFRKEEKITWLIKIFYINQEAPLKIEYSNKVERDSNFKELYKQFVENVQIEDGVPLTVETNLEGVLSTSNITTGVISIKND